MRPRHLFLSLLMLALACGCSTEPVEELVIGQVCCFYEGPRIDVPDTVDVGLPFPVTIDTYGNGCFSKGHTDVTEEEGRVVLTPYDYRDLRARVCDDVGRIFEHEAFVTIETAGEATVIVRGRLMQTDQVQEYPHSVWARNQGGSQ